MIFMRCPYRKSAVQPMQMGFPYRVMPKPDRMTGRRVIRAKVAGPTSMAAGRGRMARRIRSLLRHPEARSTVALWDSQ